MKRFIFLAILAIFIFTGPVFGQEMADTFHKAQQTQWLRDVINFSAEIIKLRNRADNLRKRYYSAMQAGGDAPLFATHTTYIDATYADQTSCEAATGTWTDGACYFSITDETTCEATDGYFWTGSACQSVPYASGTDYQLLSPVDISNMIVSIDDFVDNWMDGTSTPQSGNGTNVWKIHLSE